VIGVADGVLVNPDVAGVPEGEVGDGDAVPVKEGEGESDGAGEALGDGVGAGAVMVVVVLAAWACKTSKVDQEPTICTIAARPHIAVQVAQATTATPSTGPRLPRVRPFFC
jgi:hypothetical protein